MILPPGLSETYRKKSEYYNQTASKAEQIALCQFIRDGHLSAQTRRLKRLYSAKLKELLATVRETFGTDCSIQIGAAGTSLALTLPCQADGASVKKAARLLGLRLTVLKEGPSAITLLLSCSSMPTGDFRPACGLLKQVIDSF